MDFAKLKKEALHLKNKAKTAGRDAIKYGAGKLADSKFTLKTEEELEAFLKKSDTTRGKDSQTGKEKRFKHQVLVLFVDTQSDFFQEMLYVFPVLQTKSFSQNMHVRLADINMKGIDKKSYQIIGSQTLLLFEERKVKKVVSDIEGIRNLVKSMSLDINKGIEEIK